MHETPAADPTPSLSRERYYRLMDALPQGIVVLTGAGAVEFMNPVAARFLGLADGEMTGRPWADTPADFFDEEGNPVPWGEHPSLRVLATGEASPPAVLRMRRRSGRDDLWVEVTAHPIPDAGSRGGSVSTFRDVTTAWGSEASLRASEARYRKLALTLPIGIFLTDEHGDCTWVNQAWTDLTGRDLAASSGAGWTEALHPEDRQEATENWRSAMSGAGPSSGEYRVVTEAGGVRWVTCRVARAEGGEKEPPGCIGSVLDITEAKTAEHLKDQLLGLASHELRAPLISIRGGLTFLEPYIRDADEDGRRLYDIAMRNAQLLERLVKDLLDIERLEGGRTRLELKPLLLGPVLTEAREGNLAAALERGVVLEEPEGDDRTVRADSDRLLQVLNNLLSNAIKFSEPGGRVRTEILPREGGVVVAVRDQGRGIPGDMVERVFERFIQVDPADSAERGGAGLGLAICRAIVNRHGGHIWAESGSGEGASFFFFLPAATSGVES